MNIKPRIAVFAPRCVTGGVEALHQIANALQSIGHEVGVSYYEHPIDSIVVAYAHYDLTVLGDRDYEWAVIPEIRRDLIHLLKRLGKRVAFWHLGVGSWPHDQPDVHLACGTHAVSWCRGHRVEPLSVSDYIGRDFTSLAKDRIDRRSCVAYGWRGDDKIDKIKAIAPEIQFIRVGRAGMTGTEVANQLRQTRAFLEAGGTGGRDRVPREAALCGAAIVWYKTDPQFDVPIRDRTDNFVSCANRLREVLRDPTSALNGQADYREWIRDAENRFRREVAAFSEFMQKV